VLVTIQADAVNGKRFRWSNEVSIDSSALPLKAKWAEAHGVPEQMVEFFDSVTELPVKLDLTPSQLGWEEEVTLLAAPADDEGAASPPDAQTLGRKRRKIAEVGGEPVAAHTKDPPAARPAVTELAAPKPAPATKAAARTAPAAKSKPAEAAPAKANAKPPPAPNPAKAKGPPAAGSSKPAPGPPKAGASGGPKMKQEEDATKLVDLLGKNSSLPGQDEPIKYAENPKRPGTSAHARYEKYKHAKTIAEALRCGAAKGDIDHDFKSGFLRRA